MELDRGLGILATVALLMFGYLIANRSSNRRSGHADQVDPQRRVLNKLALALGLGFVGLAGRLSYVSVVQSRRLSEQTGAESGGEVLSNPRLIARALDARRGKILDRNGEVLAESVRNGDIWERQFLVPEAAHLLGYFSPLRYGEAGIEQSRSSELSGSAPLTLRESIRAGLFSEFPDGHDVQTTIDLELQRLAGSLLSGVTGSLVLIEPQTGRIRAITSSPSFDPNLLITTSDADIPSVDQAWSDLTKDDNRPLLLRATSGLYPPGSTFKALVAAAAIDAGAVEPGTIFTDNGSLEVDDRIIPEYNRPDESRDQWSVTEGLAWSLNVVFAQIGLELGVDRLKDYASRFGIGATIPIELASAPGQLSSSADGLDQLAALAATAFGQGELLVTPLHMSLVMCAIANGGRIPIPIVVDRIATSAGTTVREFEPEVWKSPIRPESAATVLEMLYGGVSYGYASGAQIPGLLVAAKTGTAESGREAPHGWFIGSAGVSEPEIVVSVCLDYGGGGGGLALEIGREMLDSAISR